MILFGDKWQLKDIPAKGWRASKWRVCPVQGCRRKQAAGFAGLSQWGPLTCKYFLSAGLVRVLQRKRDNCVCVCVDSEIDLF